jgi:polyisoprenoid-binding protein YceI
MRRGGLLGIIAVLLLALTACGGGATPTAGGAAATAASTTAAGATNPASSTAPTSSAATTSAAPAATTGVSTATTGATGTATRAVAGTVAATAPRASATAPSAAARYTIAQPNSKATYKVSETFFNQGNRINIAEGTTTDIVGDLFIDKTKPSASRIGTITVNISKLESDSEQRDDQIRARWLESTKYPTATFVPKHLEGLPDTPYTDGTDLTFKIIGDLTVRTVTKEVTFNATGKIVGDLFTGTATTQFNMTDFGFDPPSILGILKAENGVELVLVIEAKRVP